MAPRFIVTAAIAPLNAEPRVGSEQVSQSLFGHPVCALEEREPWLRVRGEDGYEGWMHSGYLRAASRGANGTPASDTSLSLGCVIVGPDGVRRTLPLGALIPGDFKVDQGVSVGMDQLATRFPRNAAAITRTAESLFSSAPYLWGGITPWGADCSGFVQTCLGLHGLRLARDASQQAESGRDAGMNPMKLEPADLAFFSDRDDRRITHVAIALGCRRLAHLAIGRGGFAVEDLGDAGDPYASTLVKRFVGARRLV